MLIAFGIIVGSIAAVNSIVFSASRVSFAMGRDGNLPSMFGKLHPKKQTPVAALILSGAIIIGMVVLLPLNQVASVADGGQLFLGRKLEARLTGRPDLAALSGQA